MGTGPEVPQRSTTDESPVVWLRRRPLGQLARHATLLVSDHPEPTDPQELMHKRHACGAGISARRHIHRAPNRASYAPQSTSTPVCCAAAASAWSSVASGSRSRSASSRYTASYAEIRYASPSSMTTPQARSVETGSMLIGNAWRSSRIRCHSSRATRPLRVAINSDVPDLHGPESRDERAVLDQRLTQPI